MTTRIATASKYMSQNNAHKTLVIELPVDGSWKLINAPGHAQFAFDLVAVTRDLHRSLRKSRLQHLLGRTTTGDSYSWAQPIYAPITGMVAHAHGSSSDRERLSLLRDLWSMMVARPTLQPGDLSPYAGNYVIIRAAGAYLFLAHMKFASLQVAAGDQVERGQLIGRVGNSGFTLEPHLHLQLFDQIDDLRAAEALPFRVHAYERWTGERWELRRNCSLQKGDLIRAEARSMNDLL
jgi:hypothetical protein